MAKEVSRKQSSMITAELSKAADEIMKKHGLAFKVEAIKYGYQYKCSIIGVITEVGESVAESEFKRYAHINSMRKEDFGREFMFQGDMYKVVGLRPKARKNNVIIERKSDRKRFVINRHKLRLHPDDPNEYAAYEERRSALKREKWEAANK